MNNFALYLLCLYMCVGDLVCFNCPKVLTPASLLCYFYKWEKASGNPLVFIISFLVPKKKQVTPIRLPKNEDCLGIMLVNSFVFVLSSLFVCCEGEIARKWLTRGLGGARHRDLGSVPWLGATVVLPPGLRSLRRTTAARRGNVSILQPFYQQWCKSTNNFTKTYTKCTKISSTLQIRQYQQCCTKTNNNCM